MADLHLRASSGIREPLLVRDGHGPFTFRLRDPSIDLEITTILGSDGDAIASTLVANVSQDVQEALATSTPFRSLSSSTQEEIRAFFAPLSRSNSRVFGLLKQELHKYDGHRLSGSTTHWSVDGESWYERPDGKFTGVDWSHSIIAMDEDWQIHLQTLLDWGEQPLTSYEYLHEAEARGDPRFGWISATAAAELAIKEVLIRMEPKLTTLLLEVPSPPLQKLYGSVLEAVSGQRSPLVSKLGNGAERRNKLVHRPDTPEPDAQEFREYVATVEEAIRHLLSLDRARHAGGA